jgi:thiamine-phosphate pyrophosphorylase
VARFVPRTLAISGRVTPGGAELARWAAAVAAAGVDAIQLREKDLDDRSLYVIGGQVADAISGRCALLVNGRADVALALHAAGVHLPSHGVPVSHLRRRFPELLLGVSTHRLDEIAAARDGGADFVTYGPVYPPTTKRSALPPVGADGIARAAALGLPVLALGGVTVERLPELAAAGAAGIAAIGAFRDGPRLDALIAAAHRWFAAAPAGAPSR